eukprot:4015673-Pleurochrysis_carterae.AAC.2
MYLRLRAVAGTCGCMAEAKAARQEARARAPKKELCEECGDVVDKRHPQRGHDEEHARLRREEQRIRQVGGA